MHQLVQLLKRFFLPSERSSPLEERTGRLSGEILHKFYTLHAVVDRDYCLEVTILRVLMFDILVDWPKTQSFVPATISSIHVEP